MMRLAGHALRVVLVVNAHVCMDTFVYKKRIIKMDLKKLVRMGTWLMWPRILPSGGLCELRNKQLVSKKYVVLFGYLIECQHLKLVDWCMVI
jgi:hypothetical protein